MCHTQLGFCCENRVTWEHEKKYRKPVVVLEQHHKTWGWEKSTERPEAVQVFVKELTNQKGICELVWGSECLQEHPSHRKKRLYCCEGSSDLPLALEQMTCNHNYKRWCSCGRRRRGDKFLFCASTFTSRFLSTLTWLTTYYKPPFYTQNTKPPVVACSAPSHNNTPIRSLTRLLILLHFLASSSNKLFFFGSPLCR